MVVLIGALAAAAGAALRAGGAGGATFLLDSAGWLTAAGGAAIEARAAGFWFDIEPKAVRRRAVAFAVAGLFGALGGCVASSSFANGAGTLSEAGAMFVLVAGVGLAIAGFASLAWTMGGDYAARRIERMGDDEW